MLICSFVKFYFYMNICLFFNCVHCTDAKNIKRKNAACRRQQISWPMRIVEPTYFPHVFHQDIADYGRVLIKGTEFCQEHIFHCRLCTSSESSSRRPSGSCRLLCRLWASLAFSPRRPSWDCRLWTSSEFSLWIQSFVRRGWKKHVFLSTSCE